MKRPRLPPRDVAVWLAIGLLVRESFSFWTGHPFDTEIWLRNAYYVAHGWNPYGFMPPVPGISFAYTGEALPSVAYLPLWSLVLAALYDLYRLLPGGSPFQLYFLVKQPPILGDVLLGALLYLAGVRWGGSRSLALRLLVLWMLFPYAILISAIWGQFDSLVAATILASLLATSSWGRSADLGLGVLLKSLPVILAPYVVLRARGRDRAIGLLVLTIPVAFTATVFAITGWTLGGLSGTLLYETGSFPQGMTYWVVLGLPAVGNAVAANPVLEAALAWSWIPGVLLASWWAVRRFSGLGPADAVQAFLLLITVFFLLRWMVNEQYLIELLPLLLVDVALWHPERRPLFHAIWLLALAFLVWNNFFLVRFAAPVSPAALGFEFGLQADPLFSEIRRVVLDVLALLFSVHLVQLGLVVADPRRSATPWLVRVARRVWMARLGRTRAMGSGREG